MVPQTVVLEKPEDILQIKRISIGGDCINTCAKVDEDGNLYASTSTVERIFSTMEDAILYAHATEYGQAGLAAILKAYAPYILRFKVVIVDYLSPVRRRGHVRFWTEECQKRLYHTWVRGWDDDLKAMKTKDPITGKVYTQLHDGWITSLTTEVAKSEHHDKWAIAPHDSSKFIKISGEYGKDNAVMRSGCCFKRLGLMRKEAGDHFNAFRVCLPHYMRTNEDILAYGILRPMGKLSICNWISVEGERRSNEEVDWDRADSCITYYSLLKPGIAARAMQTRTSCSSKVSKNKTNGCFSPLANAISKTKKKQNRDSIDPIRYKVHIISQALKDEPDHMFAEHWHSTIRYQAPQHIVNAVESNIN